MGGGVSRKGFKHLKDPINLRELTIIESVIFSGIYLYKHDFAKYSGSKLSGIVIYG